MIKSKFNTTRFELKPLMDFGDHSLWLERELKIDGCLIQEFCRDDGSGAEPVCETYIDGYVAARSYDEILDFAMNLLKGEKVKLNWRERKNG